MKTTKVKIPQKEKPAPLSKIQVIQITDQNRSKLLKQIFKF